jgi:hypothetical protein
MGNQAGCSQLRNVQAKQGTAPKSRVRCGSGQQGCDQLTEVQAKPRVALKPSGGCSSGHWISSNIDEGKYIKLEDGSLWEVDGVDTVDSSLWLELDNITACDGKLINTDEKESVEARRIN